MRHVALDDGRASAARRKAMTEFVDGPKRRFDVVITCALLPVAAPLVFALALPSWLRGQPAFYAHRRIGRNGAEFDCWKLRTMLPKSQAILRQHLRCDPDAAREWAQTYKLRKDPRVTWFGRFLRKYSLDELPQVVNVLRGEMSLVGPRPITTDELVHFGSAAWAYDHVRPGLTGLWQVSGRNRLRYEDRVRLEVRYVARMSMRQDVWILCRTLGAVLKGTGV